MSFSAFHPELWQPAWGIRLILEALISFLPTPADGAIGAVDWSPAERQALAKKSIEYCCPLCGKVVDLLPPKKEQSSSTSSDSSSANEKKPSRFQKEIEELQRFQMLEHQKETDDNAKAEERTDDNAKAKEQTDAEESKETVDVQVESFEDSAKTDSSTLPASSDAAAAPAPAPVEKPVEETRIDKEPADPLLKTSQKKPSEQKAPERAVQPLVQEELRNEIPMNDAPRAAAAVEPAMVPEPAARNTPTNAATASSSSLWDPVLQLAMIVLAMICYLLVKKLQDLLDELAALEEQQE